MNSDDKLMAIFLVSIFLGGFGALAAGWVAIAGAVVAIAFISLSKSKGE